MSESLPDQPIKGVTLVEPSGKVALGPIFGCVDVGGLDVEEAEACIQDHLAKIIREPKVLVTRYDPVAHGERTLQDRVARLEKAVAELRGAIEKMRK